VCTKRWRIRGDGGEMNKRQAKIEALYIVSALCQGCDMGMWDDDKRIKEQEKILNAIFELAGELKNRAERMEGR